MNSYFLPSKMVFTILLHNSQFSSQWVTLNPIFLTILFTIFLLVRWYSQFFSDSVHIFPDLHQVVFSGLEEFFSWYLNNLLSGISCVRMVRHQSSTSTAWGSNLSITQLFHCEIFNIINCIQKMVEVIFDIKLSYFSIK